MFTFNGFAVIGSDGSAVISNSVITVPRNGSAEWYQNGDGMFGCLELALWASAESLEREGKQLPGDGSLDDLKLVLGKRAAQASCQLNTLAELEKLVDAYLLLKASPCPYEK